MHTTDYVYEPNHVFAMDMNAQTSTIMALRRIQCKLRERCEFLGCNNGSVIVAVVRCTHENTNKFIAGFAAINKLPHLCRL